MTNRETSDPMLVPNDRDGAQPVDSSDSNESSSGVMLVGHGTRDATGTAQFFQLGERLADALAPTPVKACLLEFQEPTIPQAWEQLVAEGATRVHVAPLLLFAAGHAKRDIPDLIGECQAKTPAVTTLQSGPLSRHPDVVELVCKRIRSTCDSNQIDARSSALVMTGRGSYDPCAQADMKVLTELVARRHSFQVHRTAFYAMAEPKLPQVLDEVADSGAASVIVQPHLLFEGRLYQAIDRQVREAAQRHPQVRFCLSNYLGPEPEIAAAIRGRILSADRTKEIAIK